MASGDKKLNVVTKRILGWQSFKDNLLDYLDDHDQDLITQIFRASGTFSALGLGANGTDNYAVTGYSALGTIDGIDGLGYMLDLFNRKEYADTVPFENITTNDYYVAIRKANLPQGITVSQEDGQPNFDTYEEVVGWEADPDQVIDNGNGTLTFQVDSVTESGVTNAGRTVAVYKKIPGLSALTESKALEILTVAWASSQNRITTVSNFGQTTASTTASDYRVVLLGPRTSRDTDLRTLSDWCFIGIVSGKTGSPPDTFDTADQNVIDIPFSEWSHILRYVSIPPDRLKIEVDALSGESGVDQIRINHIGTGITYKVDEAGNITTAGDVTISGKIGIGGAVGIPQFKVTGDGEITSDLTIGGHFLPSVDKTKDLGDAAYNWRILYLSDNAGQGVGTNLVPVTSLDLGSAGYKWGRLFLSTSAGKGVAGSLVPTATDSHDLGKSSYKWRKLYLSSAADEGVASDLVPVTTTGIDLGNASYGFYDLHIFQINSNSVQPNYVNINANLLPSADDSKDLGAESGALGTKRWKIIHGMGLRAHATSPGGSAGSVTLTSDFTESLSTGTGTVKMATANNADSSGWLKIYAGGNIRWVAYWDSPSP